MCTNDWKKQIFSIPNLLSLARILLIPIYIVIYLNATDIANYYIAGIILTISCLTDLVDGWIARRFNMITNLGKVLDPRADKLTQFCLVLCLVIRYRFLWYVLVLFIIKEGFQLIAGGCRLLRRNMMLKGALITGKVSTAVLFASLIILVLFPTMPTTAVKIIAAIDAVFLLLAFTDYLVAYIGRMSDFQEVEFRAPKNNETQS